jgi:hypothetical protein
MCRAQYRNRRLFVTQAHRSKRIVVHDAYRMKTHLKIRNRTVAQQAFPAPGLRQVQAPVTPPAGPVSFRGGWLALPRETGGVLGCAAGWVWVGKVEGKVGALSLASAAFPLLLLGSCLSLPFITMTTK